MVGLPLPGATPAEYRAHLLWNLRSGLNVAALQCQFSPYLRAVDNYNALLAHHARELAAPQARSRPISAASAAPRAAPVRLLDPDLQQFLDPPGPVRLLPDRGPDRQGSARPPQGRASSSRRRGCASCAAACGRRESFSFARAPIRLSTINPADCSLLRAASAMVLTARCMPPRDSSRLPHAPRGRPISLWVCRLSSQPGWSMTKAIDCSSAAAASAQSIGWIRKWSKSPPASSAGSMPGCGQTSLARRRPLHDLRARLGADAEPVDAARRRQRPVALHRHLEAAGVERVDQGPSSWSKGSPPVTTTSLRSPSAHRPIDLVGERLRVVAAAVQAVGADEVGVAEGAVRGGAVALAAAPQVAAGEAQEDRAPPACMPSPWRVRKISLTA